MKNHPVLALVLCALLWSAGGVMIKLTQWDALCIAGTRALLAMFVVSAAFRRLPRLWVKSEDGRINRPATVNLLFGAICYAATMLLFVCATKLTTAANAILLQYTNPVYIILFGPLLTHEKNDWVDYAAVALIMAGMVLLLSGDLDFSGSASADARSAMLGNLLALASGITWGFTTMFLRRQKDAHPADSLNLSNLIAFAVSLPFIVQRGLPSDSLSYLGLFMLGVFQIGIPSVLLSLGISRIPALSSVIITMIEPMMNPVWVALVVGEKPSLGAVCGGAVILFCIIAHVAIKAHRARRAVLAASVCSLVVLTGCASTQPDYVTPDDVQAHLLSSEPCEWMDIENPYSDFVFAEYISKAQLEKDLDMLCYLLKTSYAGYDKACARSLDVVKLKERVTVHFAANEDEKISVDEFFEVLKQELSGKIQDTHFYFYLGNWSWHFCDNYIVYWTDIFVEQTASGYTIAIVGEQGSALGITVGAAYEDSADFLFYYPAKGDAVYRVGKIAPARLPSYSQMHKENDDRINVFPAQEIPLVVTIGGKTCTLTARAEVPIEGLQTVRYGEKETEDSAYISLSQFMPPVADSTYRAGSDRNFERFMSAGSRFQNKKNLIVDLRANPGGFSTYSASFFTRLYVSDSARISKDEVNWYYSGIYERVDASTPTAPVPVIISPAQSQISLILGKEFFKDKREHKEIFAYLQMWQEEMRKSPRKIVWDSAATIERFREKVLPVPEKPHFSGKLIVLVDRNSASATEDFVATAKAIFGSQVIIIGENTSGCISYGEVYPYRLSESKIVVGISARDLEKTMNQTENWHGEGCGMHPDVWSSGADLLQTLVRVTGDSALYEKISNIEWALQ